MKSFQIKTRVNFGDNALDRLAEVPYKKILIVTDPFMAKSKNLKFRLDFSETLPRQLKFDRKRLRQVLVNILGNAFKFTETGGITFTAGFHAESEKHGDFTVAIRDTGPGMSQEEINELFVPFKQHHVRDAEGTGLGLVISRRLTERMGGRIEVESESGKGTAFSIHLPAVEYSNPVPAGQMFRQLCAVHLRHPEIGQDHFRFPDFELLQRFFCGIPSFPADADS